MNEPDPIRLHAIRGDVEQAWHRFLDVYEGLRPELFRYCRHLTRSAFEADDLVQDAMFRGFVTLGCMRAPPAHPRAWLFRVASHLWIDRLRAAPAPAEALSTTPGTVKSALHRGRGKLAEPLEEPPAPPRPQVLDAFCAAFNAGDLPRLTALLLDTAEIEVVRVHTEYGPDAAREGVFQGMLFGFQRLADPARLPPGIDPAHVRGVLPRPPRCEARRYRGEWVTLLWYAHEDGEAVRAINRLWAEGDRLVRVRNYFYTPDVIAEVCGELGVPFRTNGPRYWKPSDAPGDGRRGEEVR